MSQSLEGTTHKTRIIIQEPILYNPEHVDIVNDIPVPIIKGYVIIKVGHGASALYVKQRVIRIKNTGATNSIKKPSKLHLEIIDWFRNQPLRAKYSAKHIVEKMNEIRIQKGLKPYAYNTIPGRISELSDHHVLELFPESGTNYYVLDRGMVEKVLTEGKFIE